jgi:carbon-monoxide dehydrogenase small subunit
VAKIHVETAINGEPVEFLCGPHQSLLEVLRDVLHLTGTKEGCSTGDCGACSVVLDGRLVCSCQLLEHAGLQCGVCTPGIVVAAKALLERHPDPTESEIRYWLAGNLCRCTGYEKIVRAVLDAAAELRASGAPA